MPAPRRLSSATSVRASSSSPAPLPARASRSSATSELGPLPPTQIDKILIVVPAHDEEATIEACLRSIQVAARAVEVATSTVVVADRCKDGTVSRALDTLVGDSDIVLVTQAGSAGAARHAGTDCALLDQDLPLERIWIANTDADTVVDADWLQRQLDHARSGVVAAAGVVRLGSAEPLAGSFDKYYVIAADGTHGHVHGANIGFRADAYSAVGGWNPLHVGEDHDLWNRLRIHGSIAADSSLRVTTSARLVGRAPEGFAADLAALSALEETVA